MRAPSSWASTTGARQLMSIAASSCARSVSRNGPTGDHAAFATSRPISRSPTARRTASSRRLGRLTEVDDRGHDVHRRPAPTAARSRSRPTPARRDRRSRGRCPSPRSGGSTRRRCRSRHRPPARAARTSARTRRDRRRAAPRVRRASPHGTGCLASPSELLIPPALRGRVVNPSFARRIWTKDHATRSENEDSLPGPREGRTTPGAGIDPRPPAGSPPGTFVSGSSSQEGQGDAGRRGCPESRDGRRAEAAFPGSGSGSRGSSRSRDPS